jgi:hypothetical protein
MQKNLSYQIRGAIISGSGGGQMKRDTRFLEGVVSLILGVDDNSIYRSGLRDVIEASVHRMGCAGKALEGA